MNKINQISGKEKRKLKLFENDYSLLKDLRGYIPNMMKLLWKQPNIVASIIEKTNSDDLRKHLAPLFVHNFYENIISSKSIEDNLMYIFTLLIKSEIMNLNDIVDKNKFLEDTPCGIMLEELIQKPDIQEYMIKITKKVIESLEKNNSKNKITFNPDEICVDNYEQMKIKSDSKPKNSINYSSSIEENSNEDNFIEQKNKQNLFNKKYMLNLDESSLMSLEEDYKDDKNIYEYLNSKTRKPKRGKNFRK